MAALQPDSPVAKRRHGIAKKRFSLDMTPMVDLGFLLISFFIFTSRMTTPGATNLIMPKGEQQDTKTAESKTITAILQDDETILFYAGKLEDALKNNSINKSSYAVQGALSRSIVAKRAWLDANKKSPDDGGKNDLMIIIKPCAASSYGRLIDALDLVSIHDVRHYAIVDPAPEELDLNLPGTPE